MTIREFLENVISADISNEMNDFARLRIEKLDEKNEKKKTTSKKKTENDGIKNEILEFMMSDGAGYKASDIATQFGISTQKASALLVQLVKDGKVTATEVRVKGKGKVKEYRAEFNEIADDETE